MSNAKERVGQDVPTPGLQSILAKVRELAQSATSQPAKSHKADASALSIKRAKLQHSQYDAAAGCSADKSAESSSKSAVTITFGDCAENHAGAAA
jgi:hypothetical protein